MVVGRRSLRTVSRMPACAAYGVFALCLVGMVAWALWSDSDLWAFLFAAIGIAVLLPVILGPSIRAGRAAFSSPSRPSDSR
jgi:glucose dehydrogenase